MAKQGKEGNALSTKLWAQCALILNADVEDVQKSAQEWKKYYNQYKSRTKAKQRSHKMRVLKTGEGPADDVHLTPLEERFIGIIGGCSSLLPAVRQNLLDILTVELTTSSGGNDGN